MKKKPSHSLPDLPDDDPRSDDAVRRRLDDLSASMSLLPQRRRDAGVPERLEPVSPPPPPRVDIRAEARMPDVRLPDARIDDRARNRGMPGTVSVSVMLPLHTNRDLTIRAAQRGVTKRFLIVEALRRSGYDVHEEDLTEDGRRRHDQ